MTPSGFFKDHFEFVVVGDATPAAPKPASTGPRSLTVIAADIKRSWKKVYFGAVPYLDAMGTLDKITDTYGQDDARYIVTYFLGNATGFKGDEARRLKLELKALLEGGK